MNIFKSRKLVLITAVYWFLLVYVVAALVWWFISLEKQNHQMTKYKLELVKQGEANSEKKTAKIFDEERRKTGQYIGEGTIFLALIIFSAVFIYRATRRQFRLSLQQNNFMMAITHELKTPIAVAKLNLETMQRRKLEEVQQQKLISNTLQEANRLNSLCNNILLASQFDAGAYKINKSEVNFSDVVSGSIDDFNERFPNRIQEGKVEDILMMGEELLLQLLVNNLLENAIKYSPNGGAILIELYRQEQHIYLTIADQGAGIEVGEEKKIFDKFYRIGNESTRNTKGTGLGLYLCKKIAHDHNGIISVHPNQPQGSIFTVGFKS